MVESSHSWSTLSIKAKGGKRQTLTDTIIKVLFLENFLDRKRKKTKSKMGFLLRASIVAVCLGLAALVQNYRLLKQPLPAPKFDLQEYWGPGKAADYKENTAVTPFDIATKPEVSSTTSLLS